MYTTYPKVTQFPKECFPIGVFDALKTLDDFFRELRKKNPCVGYDGVRMANCYHVDVDIDGDIIPKKFFLNSLKINSNRLHNLQKNGIQNLNNIPKDSVVPYIDIEVTYVSGKLFIKFTAGYSRLDLGSSVFFDLGQQTTCINLPYKKQGRFLNRIEDACNCLYC